MHLRSEGVLVVGFGGAVRQLGDEFQAVPDGAWHVVGHCGPSTDQPSLPDADRAGRTAADHWRLQTGLARVAQQRFPLRLGGCHCNTHTTQNKQKSVSCR
eukprot:TRINITY_DN105962_c0_g1_i1.p2 TRINITY_DN105962_c0_g1~~TRINITY_DN105962_c0_g1_i1.p2  ORF type:complete len:100 (+),score=11.94 TRINITY_DN105962_c0_g1_i1:90-389(+)